MIPIVVAGTGFVGAVGYILRQEPAKGRECRPEERERLPDNDPDRPSARRARRMVEGIDEVEDLREEIGESFDLKKNWDEFGEIDSPDGGRVEWTEGYEVPVDRVLAPRMMAGVAGTSAGIKRRAGVSARGRPCEKPVWHIVLAWKAGEEPGEAEQRRTVKDCLRYVGLEGHQAVAAAHNDTAHRHVHIIVNRVSPTTGRAVKMRPGYGEIQDWAHEYEEGRGEIQCPARERRVRAFEQSQSRTRTPSTHSVNRFPDGSVEKRPQHERDAWNTVLREQKDAAGTRRPPKTEKAVRERSTADRAIATSRAAVRMGPTAPPPGRAPAPERRPGIGRWIRSGAKAVGAAVESVKRNFGAGGDTETARRRERSQADEQSVQARPTPRGDDPERAEREMRRHLEAKVGKAEADRLARSPGGQPDPPEGPSEQPKPAPPPAASRPAFRWPKTTIKPKPAPAEPAAAGAPKGGTAERPAREAPTGRRGKMGQASDTTAPSTPERRSR